MKTRLLIICLALLGCTSGMAAAAVKKPAKPVKKAEVMCIKPTREAVLAIADKYIQSYEPELEMENRQNIDKIKTRLDSLKGMPDKQAEEIHWLANQLTITLAGMNSLDAVATASAYLVKYAPDNSRATNLLGSSLHTMDKLADSITVLEYSYQLSPKSTIAMLNLANACMDNNQDNRARELLEKAVKLEPDNRSAYKTFAYYWYKKKNKAKEIECLRKAAQFVGVVKKASAPEDKEVQKNDVDSTDGIVQMEAKINALADCVPFTTADIIENCFPEEARQIRANYCRLIDSERIEMPRLPEINTSTNKDYIENAPIITAWLQVPAERYATFEEQNVKSKYGITRNDSEESAQQKAKAGAKKEMAESMDQARQALEMMKGMPGISQADINKAMSEVQKAAKQQGISLGKEPAKNNAPPGFDAGSSIARMNYANYVIISNSHEQYISKLFSDYLSNEKDILEVYQKHAKAIVEEHERRWEKLQKEHNSPNSSHGAADIPCKREMLRYKKAMNECGLTYYKQWVNLYMPMYAQKVKPAMDTYWRVSMLYVKNMQDPKILEHEYTRVKSFFMLNAMTFTQHAGIGSAFAYLGPTDEEEAALEQAIRQAEQEAKEKKPRYLQEFDTPKDDWVKWIGDHLQFEVSGQFLTLKITPGTIEFGAWAFGPSGTVKLDMINSRLQTSTGLSAKADIGVKIFGADAKLESKVDFVSKTAEWDLENGTYREAYEGPKGETKASLGPASLSGEVTVDAQFNAKGAIKAASSAGGFQIDQTLIEF